jgi:hypothetical protein
LQPTSVAAYHGPPKSLRVCRGFGTWGGLADRDAVLAERFLQMHLTRVVAVAAQVAFFPQISSASERRRFPCEEPKAPQRTSIQDRRVSCFKSQRTGRAARSRRAGASCGVCRSGQLPLLCGRAPMTATSKATAGTGRTEHGAINCSGIEPSLSN